MQPVCYIGLDVHKRKITYCVKDGSGRIHAEGSISATRVELDHWMRSLPQPWSAAIEATMFTGWIYDHLKPRAAVLKVAHPLMLRAIAVAKKKNDRIDASKICDCLRCDFPAGEPHGADGDSRAVQMKDCARTCRLLHARCER
jgi:transposase